MGWPTDSLKITRWLLIVTCMVAGLSIFIQAQGGSSQAQSQQAGLVSNWTPATFLSVCSVIFAFGVSWQTIMVHGKVLKDFEEWRKDTVDPTLGEHAVEIGVLKNITRSGRWDGRERRDT